MNKQLRHYVELADKEFRIPSSFEKFIEKHKIKDNLILKQKNIGFCTHCQHEFTTNRKINQEMRCPFCNNKYLVKRFNLKHYESKKDLILLDKVEDKFVLRVFELCSTYKQERKKFKYACTEYRRVFFDDAKYNQVVEGDNVCHNMGMSFVWHNMQRTCWKKKEWPWYYKSYGDTIGYISPYNIKQLLKGTKYQYTQLWKFVTKVEPLNLVELFQKCLREYSIAFELLVKLKLYNLAFCSNRFGTTNKTFEERFGVPKTLLPFMQKHNITYEELDVLRCCKIPNICLLRALTGCQNLLWLSYRIDFLTAWKAGLLSYETEHEYTDYLRFAIQLDYDMKDKKILYPSNLREEHDRLADLVEVVKSEANTRLLKERYNRLKENIYKTKKFIIYPVSSSEELINESKQQKNCVKTYTEKAAFAECDIYFMRLLSDPSKSLVTIEVRNNQIVQAELKYHEKPTKEQWRFLENWQRKILGKEVLNNA